MDKNPRQITRLRYLDARNLEKFVNSLTYESDTNTFEIGTKLYVDGKFEVNDDAIFRGNLDAYNDSALTFYKGDNAQTPYMSMSPLFDTTTLSFLYYDGQAITTGIDLDVSVDAQILTDKNVKTFFGNKSIVKDPTKPNENNIDLYKHYLEFEVHVTSAPAEQGIYTCRILVQSSSNVDCTSTTGATQKLKDLLKCDATNKYYEIGIAGGSAFAQLYGNSTLLYVLVGGIAADINSIKDRVETI